MIFIKQEISNFITSNLTQEYNDYDSTTTYIYENIDTPSNDSVVRLGGYYWRSLIDSNIGNNPLKTENIKWIKWKPSNAYAMLDQKSLTKSVNIDSDIVVEFIRGKIDSLGFGYLETASIIIEHYDESDNLLPEFTQTIDFSVNETVYDLWSYIYDEYTEELDRGIYVPISLAGYKIKVTIKELANANQSSCGFLIGGEAIKMGETLDEVSFSFNSFSTATPDAFGNLDIIKRSVQDLVDFNTIINKGESPLVRRQIKKIYDEIVLFVIDESNDSIFENMLTLGKINNASTVAKVSNKNIIGWSIFESI